jgi:hypothetical protein
MCGYCGLSDFSINAEVFIKQLRNMNDDKAARTLVAMIEGMIIDRMRHVKYEDGDE